MDRSPERYLRRALWVLEEHIADKCAIPLRSAPLMAGAREPDTMLTERTSSSGFVWIEARYPTHLGRLANHR